MKENKDKDVVIKSNHDIEFTFEKGSMSEVENMENYDFRTALEQKFEEKSEYGKKVNEGNFVIRINYNYSGKLPGEASIKIHVGIENKGITLYYSKLCDDGKILLVYSGVVDDDGYITVKQDSCSDYILTTERVDDEAEQDSVSKPADKDGGIGVVILVIAIIAVIVAALTTTFIIMKKRRA